VIPWSPDDEDDSFEAHSDRAGFDRFVAMVRAEPPDCDMNRSLRAELETMGSLPPAAENDAKYVYVWA
jgi:hypothetical protein